MKQDWTDKLRDKMFGYEVPAPEGLWDNISKELDNMRKNDIPSRQPNLHAKTVRLRLTTTAIAAIILCVIGFFFVNKIDETSNNNSESIASAGSISNTTSGSKVSSTSDASTLGKSVDKKDNISVPAQHLLASASNSSTKGTVVYSLGRVAERTTENKTEGLATKQTKGHTTELAEGYSNHSEPNLCKTQEGSSETVHTSSAISSTTDIRSSSKVGDTSSEKEKTTTKQEYHYPQHYYDNHLTAQLDKHQSKETGWDVNMYFSNVPSPTNNSNNSSSMLMAARDASESTQFDCNDGLFAEQTAIYNTNESLQEVLSKNFTQETTTNIKHKQPVRFGITAKYNFNSRWALESGFTYTYLTSDIYSGTDENHYQSTQKLYYIGIPLNVIYTIWGNQHLSVYASGGGMGEYCIKGQLNTDYIIDDRVKSSASEKISNHHLQWSLNGAAGFQYSFMRNVGIYVEPGISYYFGDGSSLQTIYKEHPTNFSLKFGLRITIK